MRPWEVPLDWEPPKLLVDGFEFDWRKLREDRIAESWEMRSKQTEEERKGLMRQWMRNSNPDLEIYPPEMVAYQSKGVFIDLKSFKLIRFGS